MGYEATDTTKRAVIAGLDALSDANQGDVLKRVEKHGDLYAPVLELKQELPSFAQLAGSAP